MSDKIKINVYTSSDYSKNVNRGFEPQNKMRQTRIAIEIVALLLKNLQYLFWFNFFLLYFRSCLYNWKTKYNLSPCVASTYQETPNRKKKK